MRLAAWVVMGILLSKRTQASTIGSNCEPVIKVEQGLLRGTCMTTLQGNKFHAFKGIPYGMAPVGKLRFQAPQQAKSWDGIYDASKDSPICPQLFPEATLDYKGDEDCLRLYVFAHPLSKYNKSLPVVVYIHGGFGMRGSATFSFFHPVRLMSNTKLPTVIVAIQYRLACFGFLSTGDSASPGNYAGLDQLMALQWVQKNIDQFGGDPNQVTVAGDSAGGISAINLLVVPETTGLFRAIATFSGAFETRMAIQEDPLANARKLGESVQCRSDNTTVLVDCLRGKTAAELTWGSHSLMLTTGNAFPWAIVAENPETAKYMKENPEKSFAEGRFRKVPVMLGTTKDETTIVLLSGYFNLMQLLPMIPVITEIIVFNIIVPLLIYAFLKYHTNLHALSYAIKRKYADEYNFHDKKQLVQFLIDMTTDATLRVGTDKLARSLAAQGVATYLYSFEYHGDFSEIIRDNEKEVSHTENAKYFLQDYVSPNDSRMSDILVSHVLNYVHYLDPTPGDVKPKWTTTPSDRELLYLRYGDNEIAMKQGYFSDKMEFWRTQMPKIIAKKRFNGSTVMGLRWA